jgi:hypothetical protein
MCGHLFVKRSTTREQRRGSLVALVPQIPCPARTELRRRLGARVRAAVAIEPRSGAAVGVLGGLSSELVVTASGASAHAPEVAPGSNDATSMARYIRHAGGSDSPAGLDRNRSRTLRAAVNSDHHQFLADPPDRTAITTRRRRSRAPLDSDASSAPPDVVRAHGARAPMGAAPEIAKLMLGMIVSDADALAGLADALAPHLRPTSPESDRWMDTKAAAAYLGLSSANALHKLTAARLIPFEQDGPGAKCWFQKSQLDAWRRGEFSIGLP